jgi:hypothetical protein
MALVRKLFLNHASFAQLAQHLSLPSWIQMERGDVGKTALPSLFSSLIRERHISVSAILSEEQYTGSLSPHSESIVGVVLFLKEMPGVSP